MLDICSLCSSEIDRVEFNYPILRFHEVREGLRSPPLSCGKRLGCLALLYLKTAQNIVHLKLIPKADFPFVFLLEKKSYFLE